MRLQGPARAESPCAPRGGPCTVASMWTVIVILLVVWAILAVVGFVFNGLLWLASVGIVLFVGTLVVGVIRQRIRQRA